MAPSPTVAFRWPAPVVEAIDSARGDVSRSRYVLRIVENHLQREHVAAVADVVAGEIPGQMTVEDAIAEVDPVLKEPPRAWLEEDVLDEPPGETLRGCPQCGDTAVSDADWTCAECGYKLAPHER